MTAAPRPTAENARFEFDAGVRGGEAPVDTGGSGVAGSLPSCRGPDQPLWVFHALIQALPGEDGEFDLGHVQPGAVFGRVMDFQPLGQAAGFLGWVSRVQAGDAVGVESVEYGHDLLGGRIKLIAARFDNGGEVRARALLAHKDMPPPGQRSTDHEESRRALAFILTVHPFNAAGAHG